MATSASRNPNIIEAHLKQSFEVSERTSLDSRKRRSRPISTQSAAPNRSSELTVKSKMHGSDESIRPLRKDSEKSENSDCLPLRPEPVYTRSGRTSLDPEKQDYSYQQSSLTPGFTPTVWPVSSPSQPSSSTTEWNCEYVPEEKPPFESHLGLIHVYLSTINPLVAMVFSFYTLATVLFFSILVPLSLLTNRQPFHVSIISSVSPAVRLQLRFIYAYPDYMTAERASHVAWAAILAPFYAMAVAVAGWVASAFWCFTAILGEPNERQGEEQDGREAIRAVRRLWERWLMWGLS